MVVGTPKEEDKDFLIGEVCTVPEAQVKRAYEGHTYMTDVIEDPSHGSYLSVGTPIKDATGKVIGYLGIDISTNTLNDIKGKVLQK